MNLPVDFLNYMQGLLGNEYNAYLDSLNKPAYHGLRSNRLKIKSEELLSIFPGSLKKVPFIDNGFIYDNNQNPAKDAYYHAGLYYLQEPSAMLPANRLPIESGDTVLDLCAAPGGKATELAGKLNGTGVLYANDISASRALALLKNLELSGAHNIYVTAETPENLSIKLKGYFNKILCDVPCSGEGMFRKEPSLIKSWVNNGPDYYQPIQRSIIDSAYQMLKPGGMMMYSTCTFNEKEDEDNILYFLDKYKDMSLVEIEEYEGFSKGLKGLDKCVRVFPHKMIGEGHFLALLKKDNPNNINDLNEPDECKIIVKTFTDNKNSSKSKNNTNNYKQSKGSKNKDLNKNLSSNDNEIKYKLPGLKDNGYREGLRYIRTGLTLGDSQSYAMTLSEDDYNNCLNLKHDDIRTIKYLKGETLFLEEHEHIDKGLVLVLVDGYALGFAKSDGSMKLKNLYNKTWKME